MELAEICAKSEHYIGTEGGGWTSPYHFLQEEGTVGDIELFGNVSLGKFMQKVLSVFVSGWPVLLGCILG